ncbi:MAG: WD40 repeat domain-containing serine/threonine protein kinase [Gemmataceae bacterium]
MPRSMACPNSATLEQWFLGRLAAPEARAIQAHVQSCAACRQALEESQSDTHGGVAPAPHEATAAFGPGQNREPGSASRPGAHAFLAPPQGPDEIGRLERYRVLKVLGEGDMGIVFQAEDTTLKRHVALKVMKPQLAANPIHKERFLREAHATAKLRDDHIVTIYEVGEKNGVPFIAMEFLEGMPLDQWLAKGRNPSILQTLRLGRQLALGLAAAHDKGLIHRDIKPGNLWIEASGGGRIKILDFGLVRHKEDDVNITRSGTIVGTPAYMSPEQARGLKLDQRSDLFSLGCVLYRLVTGQIPFPGQTTMAILTSLAVDRPKAVHEHNAEAPRGLADLIHKLLAKEPEARPATARSVAQALLALEKEQTGLQTQTIAAALPIAEPIDTTVIEPAPRIRRKRRWLRWAGFAGLAFLVLVVLHALTNPKGTLDVQIADAAVRLTIHVEDALIEEKSSKREFELPAGKGKIEAFEPDGARLFEIGFTIVRNQRTPLNLNDELARRRVPRGAERPPPDADPGGERMPLERLKLADCPPDAVKAAGPAPPPELVGAWRATGVAPGKTPSLREALFMPKGDWMLTAGANTPVLFWSLRKPAAEPIARYPAALGVWLAGAEPLLFAAYPGRMDIVASAEKGKINTIQSPLATRWQVSPDGRWVAAFYESAGKIVVFAAATGKEHKSYSVPPPVKAVLFHPKEPWLLVQYWQSEQRRFLQFFDLDSNKNWEGPPKDEFGITDVLGASAPAFSPDGRLLVFGTVNQPFLQRYDLIDEKILPRLGPFQQGTPFALSPKSDRLAAIDAKGKLSVRFLKGGDVIHEVDLPFAPKAAETTLTFTPDGRHVAVAYHDLIFLYRLA